jgi:hypothetical protein
MEDAELEEPRAPPASDVLDRAYALWSAQEAISTLGANVGRISRRLSRQAHAHDGADPRPRDQGAR